MSHTAIICVDDEITILESLKEQLKRQFGNQYLYEMAENVEDAWEILDELQAEKATTIIIVSDWLMPDLKGDEFLIQVRQQFPSAITIMLTGQATPAAIDRAREEADLYCCLSKPWTETELVSTIKSALRDRAPTQNINPV